MEKLISKLSWDKYKITSWNENLIKMDLFKSFIKVELTVSKDHLGATNGWTEYFNTEHKLKISGGWFKGVEWLSSMEYGKNLHNPYNNFCTPFYLAPIMTQKGLEFFKDYYKSEIYQQLFSIESKIESLKEQIEFNENKLFVWSTEIDKLINP